MCAKLSFLVRCKKRAGLIGPDTNKKDRHQFGGGGGGDSILCPWGTISASRLCPGGGTASAPTPGVPRILVHIIYNAVT